MPELFQISRSHSGMGKKGGSMDLVRLSGGLLVKRKSYFFFLGGGEGREVSAILPYVALPLTFWSFFIQSCGIFPGN
jgi:hypothetical protein